MKLLKAIRNLFSDTSYVGDHWKPGLDDVGSAFFGGLIAMALVYGCRWFL